MLMVKPGMMYLDVIRDVRDAVRVQAVGEPALFTAFGPLLYSCFRFLMSFSLLFLLLRFVFS